MLPTWIFLICLPIAWWGIRQPGRMLPVMLASCAFLASAALEAVLLGGAPITPALFFVPFVWYAVIRWQGTEPLRTGMSLREPGGWLLAYTGWLVFSAVFMPRIFAGDMLVYATSRTSTQGGGVEQVWLAPSSTNLTQGMYVVLGLGMFLGVRALAAWEGSVRWLLRGLYAAASINLLMVGWDLAQSLAGQDLGLSWVRNANYAVVSQSIGGWARLQGAFAEPAALAAFTVVPFSVLLALWLRGVEPSRTGPLALLSGLALLATLSSTAFVSLVVVTGLVLASTFLAQLNLGRQSVKFGLVSAAILALLTCICVIVLWWPTWLQRLLDIAHTMVFEKAESTSGQERLAWALGTWHNFLDSYGLGSGTGSARGSSLPLVILGNAGIPGLTLMLMFVGLCLFQPPRVRPAPTDDPSTNLHAHLLFALRMGLVGRLVPLCLSGTMIDPGALFYVVSGAVAGLLTTPSVARTPHRASVTGESGVDSAYTDTRVEPSIQWDPVRSS
jgi:hypothetical protein